MGDFEIAQAKDISVTIDGSTKMLQSAIDNGEIGGGDSSWTGTHAEWESLLASEKAKYTKVIITDDTSEVLGTQCHFSLSGTTLNITTL